MLSVLADFGLDIGDERVARACEYALTWYGLLKIMVVLARLPSLAGDPRLGEILQQTIPYTVGWVHWVDPGIDNDGDERERGSAMTSKRLMTVAVLLALLTTTLGGQRTARATVSDPPGPDTVLSQAQLHADVRQLVSYLEQAHPDPYGDGGKLAFHRDVREKNDLGFVYHPRTFSDQMDNEYILPGQAKNESDLLPLHQNETNESLYLFLWETFEEQLLQEYYK